MKKLVALMILLGASWLLQAQTPGNLNRNVLATVSNNETVDYGMYQVELLKALDYKETVEGYWFSYLYETTNKYNQNQNIYVNGNPLMLNRNLKIRMSRIGPSLDKCIYVLKSMDANANDIGYRMEMVRAWGIQYMVCDTVVSIDDDGFVYRLNGKYNYCKYKASNEDQTVTMPVVWLDKKVYDGDDNGMPAEQKIMFSHLSNGAVYHESPEGHYYFLHRDEYMPYTVLVIDNKIIELFDVYTDANLKIKFSYNGKHWMAVGKECYWIDGVMRSVEGFTITDFVITDEGNYGYKASKNGSDEKGELIVVDGKVVRRNARVSYFGLNADGHLKFRFLSGGRYLQYDNGNVTDIDNALTYIYYPDNCLNDEPIVVQSNDGRHKMTFNRYELGVEIDGVRMTQSTPCNAVYDERNHEFMWNAIETEGDKTELVVYRYGVVNNFFKNIFN